MPRPSPLPLALISAVLVMPLLPGCACDEPRLRRVPIPEVGTPEFDDPSLGGEPNQTPPEGDDCVSNPTLPECAAGEGTYVCNTCPGADDANPGTPEAPLRTITAGIARAEQDGWADVYVANASSLVAATYREHVVMAAGVSVHGRYVAGTPWTRSSAVRTTIENTRSEGLTFPAGLARSTVLEGFDIRSAGASGPDSYAAAVLIEESSPTLTDISAGLLVSGAPVPSRSVGVEVRGSDARPAIPLITGRTFSNRSVLLGGGGRTETIALWATAAHVDLRYAELKGGHPGTGGHSRGASFVDATGRVRDSVIVGGSGSSCVGIEGRGDIGGLQIEGNWITGCEPGGTVVPSRGAGVLVHACTEDTDGLVPFVTRNLAIAPGSVPQGFSVGVASLDGCAAEITGNGNISGGGEAKRSIGVLCSHLGWDGQPARDAACVIGENTILGGLGAAVIDSVGIACEGSCGSSAAACQGSCAELAANEVNATAGLNLVHVSVVQSSPLIRRNRIGLGGAGVACLHKTTVQGLVLQGSGSRVENNFVLAGPCEQVSAFVQWNVQRTGDGSWVGPDVHSNTIIGGGSSASTTGSTSNGVVLRTPGIVAPPPLGLYRNNIFVGGQNNHRNAFVEEDAFSDPETLQSNAFHNLPRATGSNPAIYVDEGATELRTASQLNSIGQVNTEGNLDDDPLFVNSFFDFHLQPISPLSGMGTPDDAPTEDIDRESRARPLNNRPDIGADEIP